MLKEFEFGIEISQIDYNFKEIEMCQKIMEYVTID